MPRESRAVHTLAHGSRLTLRRGAQVETSLSARELLALLKAVEAAVGRVPSVRFGPRAVDLDIVTFGADVIDTRPAGERESLDNLDGQLVVPHPRMAEREFVLRPLNECVLSLLVRLCAIFLTKVAALCQTGCTRSCRCLCMRCSMK